MTAFVVRIENYILMRKVFYLFLAIAITSCSSKLTNTTFTNEKDIEQYAAGVETDEALVQVKKEIRIRRDYIDTLQNAKSPDEKTAAFFRLKKAVKKRYTFANGSKGAW